MRAFTINREDNEKTSEIEVVREDE